MTATSNPAMELAVFHFNAIRASIHMVDMHNLYQFYFRHVDADKYGLYTSPNILERKFHLGQEVESEVTTENGLTYTRWYLTDSAANSLSDALFQVHKLVADYVGYPDFWELTAGMKHNPLYQCFEDMRINIPEEPTNLSYHYMISNYFESFDKVMDYVCKQQVWGMFRITALHLLSQADGLEGVELFKLPVPYYHHTQLASHLLHEYHSGSGPFANMPTSSAFPVPVSPITPPPTPTGGHFCPWHYWSEDDNITMVTAASTTPAPTPSLYEDSEPSAGGIKEEEYTQSDCPQDQEPQEYLDSWYSGEPLQAKSPFLGDFEFL